MCRLYTTTGMRRKRKRKTDLFENIRPLLYVEIHMQGRFFFYMCTIWVICKRIRLRLCGRGRIMNL